MCRFYLVLYVICYLSDFITIIVYLSSAICYLLSFTFYLLFLSVIFDLLSFILDFQNLGISKFNFDDLRKNCQPETSTGAIWVNYQKHLSLWHKQTNRQTDNPQSYFLIPMSLQPNVIDFIYFRLWILLIKKSKFKILKVYRLQ